MPEPVEPQPGESATAPGPARDPAATRGPSTASWRDVLRRLGPAGPLAVVAGVLPALGGFTLLALLNQVGPWLKSHQAGGFVIYIVGFAVLSGAAILPTYAQAVLGGWAFGFAAGLPAALAGLLGGATLGYGLGRRATGDRVVRLLAEHAKWQAVHDALLGSGFGRTVLIIMLVRLNSPFALTNFVLAATRVHPLAYGLGTLLGLGPRTAAAVFIAAGLKELTFERTSARWLWIAGIVATVAVVLVIGQIAQNAVARVTQRQGRGSSGA